MAHHEFVRQQDDGLARGLEFPVTLRHRDAALGQHRHPFGQRTRNREAEGRHFLDHDLEEPGFKARNRRPYGGLHCGLTRSTEEQRGHPEHLAAAETGHLDRVSVCVGPHEHPQLTIEDQEEAIKGSALLDEVLACIELNQARLTHGLAELVISQTLEERVSASRGNHLVNRLTLNGNSFHPYPHDSRSRLASDHRSLEWRRQAWHNRM